MKAAVLVVEDDDDAQTLMVDALAKRGYSCAAVASGSAALAHLEAHHVDVLVTDVRMDGMDGLELCARIQALHPRVLVIVVTGATSLDVAITAIRAGAFDFITKPFTADALVVAVNRAAEVAALREELRELRRRVEAEQGLTLVGDSPAVRELSDFIDQLAPSDATVLITGESGSGKELVARALHARSPRAAEPFIAVNCAAMPASLLESELFGHVRGAFTDAKQSRPGLLLQAGRGTVFLDEIGEMPAEMQAKMLRALQERSVRPVGGDTEVRFEARIITATNRDLEHEVAEKRFREDLYYRINVVQIQVPSLRQRADDILLLAQHFIARISKRTGRQVDGLTIEAAQRLRTYDWPGNVRELENYIERAIALARSNEITPDCLPEKLRASPQQLVIDVTDPSEMITLEEMERRYVRKVLAACGGNKTQASKLLGIDRRSLYRRLEEQGTPEPQ
jgi:DNA-binding NtrC family response regulator